MCREWHKSSYSDGSGGECVEVSEGEQTLVRDTQHRDLGCLGFSGDEWSAFLAGVKADEL
ncbi:DUF397 domain-containing protein [Streptomonospora nanhaiensis]|uniref:DUF397 domain-containing protein n=1 Tax=Streptomonospora nanhaiensis TaxID=1323731 RepID=A0A853BN05_9ACTN|nr:DUF397 domain-containing protein [Streptomonospora nanhaiensis]MBV2366657.1 DUF397 domain-containing protein [Streptomonospora nanhaiensis]NYI95842.1 hypothetical protein [Streptomonospora nanhaiensis]